MEDQKTITAPDPANPLGVNGLEFVEYATSRPEKLGAVLEKLGFVRLAHHRSREVFLYRQGTMNVIVNADPEAVSGITADAEDTQISAVAIRVADANRAYRHTVALGAWPIPTRAGAMELNIPGIHGVGDSIIYLVDSQRNFSIYDVDFNYYPGPREVPPVVPGLHFFGLVQYIGPDRSAEWVDFYQQLLGFRALPHGQHFGILPSGTILESACRQFYLQLVEPVGDAAYDVEWNEQFSRLAFGAPQVMPVVDALQARGVGFEDNDFVKPSDKGAVTAPLLPGVDFELVPNPSTAAR